MKQTYDYTPLSEHITYDQAKIELPRVDTKYKTVIIVFLILVAVLAAMTLPGIIRRGEEIWPAFVVLVPLLCVPYIFYRYHMRNTIRAAKLQRFAQHNSLTLRSAEEPGDMKGMLFETGHQRLVISSVRDTSGVEIGTYRYVTGFGRSARSHHYTYAIAPLSGMMPNIVLDSKKNNTFMNSLRSGFSSNAPEYIKKDQKVSIDPDFDKHFKTYVSDGGEAKVRDALNVDNRHTLVTTIPEWDVEVVDNQVIVFAPGQIDLTADNALQALFAKADTVSNIFDTQGTSSQELAVAAQNVALHPSMEKRLRRTAGWFFSFMLLYVLLNLVVTIATHNSN